MQLPRRILILFAHPALEKSRVQRRLLRAAEGLDHVTVHDLYERYPDLVVDAEREQQLLLRHDVVIFQHPFYWYSTPAILKEWQDIVLEHGWAYGTQGDRLHDKITFNVLSTGAPSAAYTPGGHNRFTVRQLLAPYEQTARLCGMRYLAPFVVPGALRMEGDVDVAPYVEKYRRLLDMVGSDRLDLVAAEKADTLDEVM